MSKGNLRLTSELSADGTKVKVKVNLSEGLIDKLVCKTGNRLVTNFAHIEEQVLTYLIMKHPYWASIVREGRIEEFREVRAPDLVKGKIKLPTSAVDKKEPETQVAFGAVGKGGEREYSKEYMREFRQMKKDAAAWRASVRKGEEQKMKSTRKKTKKKSSDSESEENGSTASASQSRSSSLISAGTRC